MEMVFGGLIFLIGGAIGFAVSRLTATKVGETLPKEVKDKLVALETEIREYTAMTARLESEKSALNEKLRDQQDNLKSAQAQFEVLANKIFDEKNTQSKKNLIELLNPLREELGGFKKHISDSFGNHAKEQFALKEEIARIVKVSNEMKFQTESLSKALKGDSKTQGNWGEVMLERILEASGLRKGEDYVPQAAGMGLKHPETGGTQKPDIVIKLPEGKHAIIDSKVSLTAYERYCAETEDAAKPAHLQQFLQSIKAHVSGLEQRRYQDTAGLDSPDYVMMFIPIEGAYAMAMQLDTELHAHAWDRKIIIVCPSTLFAILKIIASMWKFERQNRNADEIAARGGKLYDKVAGFVEDMLNIGRAIGKAQDTYDDAFKKLSSGTGNILRQTEQLKELGVKNAKELPQQLLSDDTVVKLAKEDAA